MVTENTPNHLSALADDSKLKKLENIEVKFTVEAGSSNITIRDLLKLNVGSVVELDTLAGEHLSVRANGTLILKGEIVTVGENLGIRVTHIIDKNERTTESK